MATQEQIDKVRSYCFNPSTTLLPDSVIAANIDKWTGVYPAPEQEGVVLYNATIDCLYYLIYTDPDAPTSKDGYKRMEKVGQVQVSIETTGEYISKWQNILNGYLNGDLTIPGQPSKIGRTVIIGGVSRTEIDRVNNTLDSVNGLKCFGVDRNRRPINPFDPFNPYGRNRLR